MDGAGRPAPAAAARRPGLARATAGRARRRCCCAATIAAANIRASSAGSTHPLARGARRDRGRSPTDGRRWTCMGPLLIDEIERLRRQARPMTARWLLLAGAAGAWRCCRSLLPWRRSPTCWPRTARSALAVLVELRLPRALLALAYGAMLGASGAAIQALFANPLASPDLTGTTSGAALGAVVTAYLFGFVGAARAVARLGGRRARRAGAAARAGRAARRDRDPAARRPGDQRAGRGADHAGAGARPLPLRFLRRL